MQKKSRLIGIDHIQLAALPGSEKEARRFYGGVLGMDEIEKPVSLKGRGGCWFRCGAQEVHIGIQPDFTPAKKAHPGFIVEDLEGLKHVLREAGFPATEDKPIAGRERFFTEDPFGNRIEFLAYSERVEPDCRS